MPTNPNTCRQGGCTQELPAVPADPNWPNHCATHAASKGDAAELARAIARAAIR